MSETPAPTTPPSKPATTSADTSDKSSTPAGGGTPSTAATAKKLEEKFPAILKKVGFHANTASTPQKKNNKQKQQHSSEKSIVTAYVTTAFLGKTTELKDKVYHVPSENPKRTEFITTTEAIALYASKHYKSQYKYLRTTVFKNYNNPSVTKPSEPKLKAGATALTRGQEIEYAEDYKQWKSDSRALEATLISLFELVIGQCSPLMDSKLRAMTEFDDYEEHARVGPLLKKIKAFSHQFETNIYPYEALDESKRQLYTFRHNASNMDTITYIKTLTEIIDVIEFYGGSIADDSSLVDYEKKLDKKAGRAVKSEKEYQQIARDKMIAVIALRRADKRFAHILKDLRNSFHLGTDNYPTSLTKAFDLLQSYHAPSGSSRSSSQPEVETPALSYAQLAIAPGPSIPASTTTVVGTNGQLFARITCSLCNSIGHYSDFCPFVSSDSLQPPAQVDCAVSEERVLDDSDDPSSKVAADKSSSSSPPSKGLSHLQMTDIDFPDADDCVSIETLEPEWCFHQEKLAAPVHVRILTDSENKNADLARDLYTANPALKYSFRTTTAVNTWSNRTYKWRPNDPISFVSLPIHDPTDFDNAGEFSGDIVPTPSPDALSDASSPSSDNAIELLTPSGGDLLDATTPSMQNQERVLDEDSSLLTDFVKNQERPTTAPVAFFESMLPTLPSVHDFASTSGSELHRPAPLLFEARSDIASVVEPELPLPTTRSSIESEIIAANDYFPWILYTTKFIYSPDIESNIFSQNNNADIRMKKNELNVGDYFTKPSRGLLFRIMRDFTMGLTIAVRSENLPRRSKAKLDPLVISANFSQASLTAPLLQRREARSVGKESLSIHWFHCFTWRFFELCNFKWTFILLFEKPPGETMNRKRYRVMKKTES